MPATDTTVVIVTHNRRDELLSHLERHEAPVVVVDNASTDGTAQALAAYPQVQVVRLPSNHGARGRTVGACLARTTYIAFADDDSWWEPGALERAETVFEQHPGLGLLAGSIVVEQVGGGSRPDPINEVLARSPLGDGGAGPCLLGFVGCAAIVRREAFFAAGGFDDVIRFPGEEERLALDLDHGGWQIAFLPELVTHHLPSPRRENPQRRRLGVIRSRLLTALMRRHWSTVWAQTRQALRTAQGRRAVLEALPRVPGALGQRRVVGEATLARLAVLENA